MTTIQPRWTLCRRRSTTTATRRMPAFWSLQQGTTTLLLILAGLVVASVQAAFYAPLHHQHRHDPSPTITHPRVTIASSSSSCTNTCLSAASTASLATLLSVEEDAPRDIANMDAWATARGVQRCEGWQFVATAEEPALDVGVVTTTDIPAQTPILQVPSNLLWSATQAKQDFGTSLQGAEVLFSKLSGQEESGTDLRFYLFVQVLFEYQQGPDSDWYNWLNSMPRYFGSGASMTHFCCSNCLPPYVGKLAMQERTRFRQFFKALDYCDLLLSKETRVHKALAKWAYNVVFTRCIEDGQGDYKLIPMGDMFNHDTYANVQGYFDEAGNYMAYSIADVAAGSQLCTYYADCTNPSFLFARYGFLDHSAPATFCKYIVENPSPELVQMGYDTSTMLFYKESGDVAECVWDVLLYQILGEQQQQVGEQQALYQAHMVGDTATKQALHGQYWTWTLAALLTHVDDFLQQLDELSGRAEGRDLTVHPRLPLILEHNEFVKETFFKVRANLVAMQQQSS